MNTNKKQSLLTHQIKNKKGRNKPNTQLQIFSHITKADLKGKKYQPATFLIQWEILEWNKSINFRMFEEVKTWTTTSSIKVLTERMEFNEIVELHLDPKYHLLIILPKEISKGVSKIYLPLYLTTTFRFFNQRPPPFLRYSCSFKRSLIKCQYS